MSIRDGYPHGVPCFVDTLTAAPEARQRFYAGIFGWDFSGTGSIPGDPPGEYFVARVRDRRRGWDRLTAGRRAAHTGRLEHPRLGGQRRRYCRHRPRAGGR